jgi:hypothetical protein
MTSLPFKIRGVFTRLVDVEGIARLENQALYLDFRMAVLTRLKTNPKEIRIPLDELEEAVFKNRFCLGFLVLRARRLGSFKGVPGNATGELRLRCGREHWETARELASRISMRTTEHQLRALLAETDRDRVSQSSSQPQIGLAPQKIEPVPENIRRTSPMRDQAR